MATLGQMLSDLDLMGITALTTVDTQALLNKCQREEVETYPWSFLYSNVVINGNFGVGTGIGGLNGGTVSLTLGSTIVTGVGTAFTSAMQGWFLWVGPTLTTPVIVAQYVSPTELVLGSPWGSPSVTNSGYTLQPLYYDVYPLIEVWRVRQITLLEATSQEALNRIDPSRIATGGNPSIRWANAPFTAPQVSGHLQVELWPRPTSQLPYIVEGKLGSIDMVQAGDQPLIPSNVLEAKAMMYVCRARTASDGDPRWSSLADKYNQDYLRELEFAKRADMRRAATLGISASKNPASRGIELEYNHDFWQSGGWHY